MYHDAKCGGEIRYEDVSEFDTPEMVPVCTVCGELEFDSYDELADLWEGYYESTYGEREDYE